MRAHPALRSIVATSILVCSGAFAACAAGEGKTSNPPRDAGADSTFDVPNLDVSLDTPLDDSGCATAAYVAKQAPATALILLDRSQSMGAGGKWSAAGLAIVKAIDDDGFDTMSLGLLASPSTDVAAPACISWVVPKVACGNPALPQVSIKPAGTEKSSATTGVRSQIYSWLSSNGPFGDYDATPLYDALKASYDVVRMSAAKSKRLVIVITDGTLSCTSVSAPKRTGFVDPNGCYDWEDPVGLVDLVKKAHDDPADPVQTFIIGVPGSDTGGKAPASGEPPYYVLRALSAMAKVGSPETMDTTCDGTYPAATRPAKSCHFDMSKGTLDAKALAEAIARIRGAALGCSYELPKPPDGSTLDRAMVNVRLESGGTATDLKRRSDPTDTCAADGCWDYSADGKVELIGKACTDAKAITDGKVSIVVGCKTVVK